MDKSRRNFLQKIGITSVGIAVAPKIILGQGKPLTDIPKGWEYVDQGEWYGDHTFYRVGDMIMARVVRPLTSMDIEIIKKHGVVFMMPVSNAFGESSDKPSFITQGYEMKGNKVVKK